MKTAHNKCADCGLLKKRCPELTEGQWRCWVKDSQMFVEEVL